MHDVNVDALHEIIARAKEDPTAVNQTVGFSGGWQTGGGPRFRATIPVSTTGSSQLEPDPRAIAPSPDGVRDGASPRRHARSCSPVAPCGAVPP